MSDPDGRRLIVTHQRPHLDEVVAIWLLRQFDPAFAKAPLQFIPYFGQPPAGDHVTTLGIGGGKYDEHKLRHLTSATRLVYDDLMHRGLIPNDTHEDKALEWLVEFADAEDQAKGYGTNDHLRPFHVANIVRSHRDRTGSDEAAINFGGELIDDVMIELNERAKFLQEWDERIEFDTPWGKGVAVHSDYGRSDTFAYSQGFVCRVNIHKTDIIASIKCEPTSNADLTEAYNKAIALEPSSWYLHQSHKMLISNIQPETGRQPTKLSLQQLIDLVKV